jgi:hypothetical protein
LTVGFTFTIDFALVGLAVLMSQLISVVVRLNWLQGPEQHFTLDETLWYFDEHDQPMMAQGAEEQVCLRTHAFGCLSMT